MNKNILIKVRINAIILTVFTFSLNIIIERIKGIIREYDNILYHKDKGHSKYIFGRKIR